MNYSLAWLREPELEPALSDLLTGLIRDIRLIIVHPDLGNAAKLASIMNTVDLLAPPPGPLPAPVRDDPTVDTLRDRRPTPGLSNADGLRAAAAMVALVCRNDGPVTLLFERLAGESIKVELTGRADRRLTPAEAAELHVALDAVAHCRAGALRTRASGLVAAEVTSVVIPARLPGATRRKLGIAAAGECLPPSDVPLGTALSELGVRREPLGARLARDGEAVAVESSARLWLGPLPVALATERITASFCRFALH
jgi:hypothetical protein